MIFEQYQLPCLSLSSYFVGDEGTGRAVVVDPQRDISQYLADAEQRGLTITHVLLTHFHADYVSGHLELARATGAEICFGEAAKAEFPVHHLADGERIELGDVVVETWATPGHTPESVTYLVYEHADDDNPYAILTGDTLFVGDVGRPDLLGAIGFTAEELGRQLFDSVHRLASLPDQVRVYPGHGAGSACGKALGSEPFTTIGDQKAHNYALQPMTRDDFVAIVTEGQPAAPAYFLHAAVKNRSDYDVFDETRELRAMSIDETLAAMKDGAMLVDTRDASTFSVGHLVGAVNVSLDGRFAEQAGMVIPADTDVIVAGDPEREREAMVRLARIGFDRVVGYVADYEAALQETSHVQQAERIDAEHIGSPDEVQLVDVRNPGETADGVVPGAILIPLGALPARVGELDPTKRTVVYCQSGIRSAVAASWMRTRGFDDVADVVGGYAAWSSLVGA
jgi:glyoxylase-like metal-dependent hydrolase (beta-lactamase superfamily II)/rhodanese-related sulfurtransferase